MLEKEIVPPMRRIKMIIIHCKNLVFSANQFQYDKVKKVLLYVTPDDSMFHEIKNVNIDIEDKWWGLKIYVSDAGGRKE